MGMDITGGGAVKAAIEYAPAKRRAKAMGDAACGDAPRSRTTSRRAIENQLHNDSDLRAFATNLGDGEAELPIL